MMLSFHFGHFHFGGLPELAKKGLVPRLPSMEFDKKIVRSVYLENI